MWRARTSGLVVQRFEDEVLVYDLENQKAHCLNTASAVIWDGCDGHRSISQLKDLFFSETGSAVNEDFILLGCKRLFEKGLLISDTTPPTSVSRRNLLKKVAVSAAIALPVVMSITAPTAVNAASALPPGSPCQNSPQCSSSNCVGIGGGNKICR